MAHVLFVCLHNAGRSQMSQALFEQAAGGRHQAASAGTTPADHVHPEVIEVMRELGVDLAGRTPRPLTTELAEWADLIVTMGCGDECPYIPGKRYVDWDLPDPRGRPPGEVRATRDEIRRRVGELVRDLDGTARPTMDWDAGSYEHVAAQLLSAAQVAVDGGAPGPGSRVLDVGCGTGNAALLAAARGARVTGVDPSPRLLEVARERAAAEGLDVTFVPGEAAQLPVEDASADLVLSVFAVVFAPDAQAAVRELARVTAPGGRAVLTAWVPEGPIAEAGRIAREAITNALGGPPGPPPFPWHDPAALADLLGPHGFQVSTEEQRIAFAAPSVADYVEGEFTNHPMIVSGRAILEPRGEAQAVRDRTLEIFEAANEDPTAFRVTSRYVLVTARRNS